MNLVLLNFSGNVGKSTLCQYLFKPRLNAQTFSIETINSNDFGEDVEILKGEQFKELLKAIDTCENALIDVGSSNVEDFFEQVAKLNAIDDFDLFVIPVSPVLKQQVDTIGTIQSLLSKGVDSTKIVVVFNMVIDSSSFERDFKTIVSFAEEGNFDLNENLIISQNDFYSENKDSGKTIEEIVNDERDFKKLIAEARKGNKELIPDLSNARIMQLMAKGVKEELDNVFYEIFGVNQIGFDDE
jgi:hypothetical protein